MKQTYTVRHGGLMRCCLLSLDDFMVATKVPPKEGDTLQCFYHDEEKPPMIFHDGGWEWNGP